MTGLYILIAILVLLIAFALGIYFFIRAKLRQLRSFLLVSTSGDFYTLLCKTPISDLALASTVCIKAANAVNLPIDLQSNPAPYKNLVKLLTDHPINKIFRGHLGANEITTFGSSFDIPPSPSFSSFNCSPDLLLPCSKLRSPATYLSPAEACQCLSITHEAKLITPNITSPSAEAISTAANTFAVFPSLIEIETRIPSP
jgi:hypothetical protein